jgi:hypothetical protein
MRLLSIFALVFIVGCGETKPEVKVGMPEELPVFSLAVSEYPSWSVFVVAKKAGLINGTDTGSPGLLEEKWGVRLKLEIKDYDPCLTMYGGGTVDACCMTNMDALNPALSRRSTVILPTSTSVGGDKVIAVGFTEQRGETPRLTDMASFLKTNTTYGLSKSVSEFVFHRGLQKQGIDPKKCNFANLEPAAAATALQSDSKDVKVICVWNPFALQTLRQNNKATVLFDSGVIPEEVIDCVVMGNDSLEKPSGDKAACLICDVFYSVCKRLNDPYTADTTLKALAEEFSNLNVNDMKIVCKDTRFYSERNDAIKLFEGKQFLEVTMPTVIKTCQEIGILDAGKAPPTFGFADPKKQLNFDSYYLKVSSKFGNTDPAVR